MGLAPRPEEPPPLETPPAAAPRDKRGVSKGAGATKRRQARKPRTEPPHPELVEGRRTRPLRPIVVAGLDPPLSGREPRTERSRSEERRVGKEWGRTWRTR